MTYHYYAINAIMGRDSKKNQTKMENKEKCPKIKRKLMKIHSYKTRYEDYISFHLKKKIASFPVQTTLKDGKKTIKMENFKKNIFKYF